MHLIRFPLGSLGELTARPWPKTQTSIGQLLKVKGKGREGDRKEWEGTGREGERSEKEGEERK